MLKKNYVKKIAILSYLKAVKPIFSMTPESAKRAIIKSAKILLADFDKQKIPVASLDSNTLNLDTYDKIIRRKSLHLKNNNDTEIYLSICISTYNRSAWLKFGLEYLINLIEPYQNLVELVICDNASTDDTEEYLTSMSKNKFFTYKRNKENVGMLGNLKITASLAKGKYIWIIGDDDIILQETIGKLLHIIMNNLDISMLYVNYSISWANKIDFSNPNEYIKTQIPISNKNIDYKTNELLRISANNENFFTAIFACIFRSDHAVKAYSQDTSGRPFSNYATCIPTTKYVMENMLSETAYWYGKPAIVVNPDVSWKRHLNLWFLEICPKKYLDFELMGIPKHIIDQYRLTRIPEIIPYLKKSIEEASENCDLIKLENLFSSHMHLGEFRAIVPKIIKIIDTTNKLSINRFDILQYVTKYEKAAKKISSRTQKARFGIVTTWGTKCGIANYSQHIYKNIKNNTTIFAMRDQIKNIISNNDENIIRSWDIHFPEEIFSFPQIENIDVLIIQHHPAFFDNNAILNLVKNATKLGIRTLLIPHNLDLFLGATDQNFYDNIYLNDFCILSHTKEGLKAIKQKSLYLSHNSAFLPHGIGSLINCERYRKELIISSFGFLLPHKGILELIKAIKILINEGVNVKLNLYCSRLDERSDEYQNICNKFIIENNLEKNIFLDTQYYPEETVINLLGKSTLIALPYTQTHDTSSAAARTALRSGVPIICTKIAIFEDIQDISFKFKNITIEAIANDIRLIVYDKHKLDGMSKKQVKYVEHYSWKNISNYLTQLGSNKNIEFDADSTLTGKNYEK